MGSSLLFFKVVKESYMEFRILKEKLANNFATMLGNKTLFEVDVDKDILWDLYLDSFPSGTNPIYRERRVYDCSS